MKIIARLFVIIGITLLLIPSIGSFYTQLKQERLYQEYLQKVSDDWLEIDKPLKPEKEQEVVKEKQDTDELTENLEGYYDNLIVHQGEVVGKIIVDKVDIDLILLQGVTNDELKWGAGHMLESAWPGEVGNCVIAGHRNYTFGSMFNRLGEVKEGDEVKIEFLGADFIYKVNQIEIVDPDNLSVVEQDKSKKELTLITCHPIYTGTHRLIIKGELKE